MFNVNVNGARREWPAWHQRGRIKAVDDQGNVVEGKYACNGEEVAISPRFQKNGVHYRVRPQHPAAFFAAFLHEGGVLPTLLTTEECSQDWALELLDPLWEQYKGHFSQLQSPYAASDTGTVPSHRNGFSFNILQILIQPSGSVRPTNGKPTFRPATNGSASASPVFERIKNHIEAMRARAGTKQEPPAPAKKKG